MSDDDQPVLNQMFGDEAAENIGTAYGGVLASLYERGFQRVPRREVRLAVASALLVQAGRGERDPARLMQAAINSLDDEFGTPLYES